MTPLPRALRPGVALAALVASAPTLADQPNVTPPASAASAALTLAPTPAGIGTLLIASGPGEELLPREVDPLVAFTPEGQDLFQLDLSHQPFEGLIFLREGDINGDGLIDEADYRLSHRSLSTDRLSLLFRLDDGHLSHRLSKSRDGLSFQRPTSIRAGR